MGSIITLKKQKIPTKNIGILAKIEAADKGLGLILPLPYFGNPATISAFYMRRV